MAATRSHYPVVEHRVPEFLEAANMMSPPDGFDPNRDGAAAWLALRMSRHISEEI